MQARLVETIEASARGVERSTFAVQDFAPSWPMSLVGRYATGELHPAILWLVAIVYAGMVGVFWLGFVGPDDIFQSMAISTNLLAMAIAVPWVIAHTRRTFIATHGQRLVLRHETLAEFLAGSFDTFTGRMKGSEAATLILSIPICLAVAATAIAVVYRVVAYA